MGEGSFLYDISQKRSKTQQNKIQDVVLTHLIKIAWKIWSVFDKVRSWKKKLNAPFPLSLSNTCLWWILFTTSMLATSFYLIIILTQRNVKPHLEEILNALFPLNFSNTCLWWIFFTTSMLATSFYLIIISKFSAPTIAFLAFWLAKKLRLSANSRSFMSYGK